MPRDRSDDALGKGDAFVGPFTGFGNFFGKELTDWWKSWRLIIVFAIPTLIVTLMVFFAFSDFLRMADRVERQRNEQYDQQRNKDPQRVNHSEDEIDIAKHAGTRFPEIKKYAATFILLGLFQESAPALFIFIIVF